MAVVRCRYAAYSDEGSMVYVANYSRDAGWVAWTGREEDGKVFTRDSEENLSLKEIEEIPVHWLGGKTFVPNTFTISLLG